MTSLLWVVAALAVAAPEQPEVGFAQVAPLYHFASRVSTALVVPLSGLLIFAAVDILSLYQPRAAAALPLLYILVTARALEAIVGPASTIVEMIGHRALPVLNSFIAYPTQSLIGSAILVVAAAVYFIVNRRHAFS